MRVLVSGDRNWTDEPTLHAVLSGLRLEIGKFMLVVGDARGADTIAWEWATKYKVKRRMYRANWEKYGRAAGPRRNLRMLTHGKPDLVVAFHQDIRRSKGTKHCVDAAARRGIPVILIGGWSHALDLKRLRSDLRPAPAAPPTWG